MADIDDQLTDGSHYEINSLKNNEDTIFTRGFFRGYVHLGDSRGIKIELDDSHEEEGKMRIIPILKINHIDIIEQKEADKDEEKEKNTYFG